MGGKICWVVKGGGSKDGPWDLFVGADSSGGVKWVILILTIIKN